MITNLDFKSLQLQIFNNLYDKNVYKLIDIKDILSYIQSDLMLKSKTMEYRKLYKSNPGEAKLFKYKEFKELSLIQYRNKKELDSFNKAYGLILDIDKKDNLEIDLKALFLHLKQDNFFNIGFISLGGGIKLIRFFDYPITNLELLQTIKSLYYHKLENRYNVKIDFGAYKHTFLNSSSELFYNFNHTSKSEYWIDAAKEIIAKKETIIKNDIVPGEGDPPNLIEACNYLATIKLSYQDWLSCCFGLANSFKSPGLKYWNIICNNNYYTKPKDKRENQRIWNNAIKKGQGKSTFTTIIKIAMNNGFIAGGK